MIRASVILAVLLLAVPLVSARTWELNGEKHIGSLRQTIDAEAGSVCGGTFGYYDIDAATDKHYFWSLFPSNSNPSTDPIVIWLTGGPGCSSEVALFAENGPCHVSQDGQSTTPNQYGWNQKANLVYVDQPAGTGFSYADQSGYDSNEKEVAEDMFHFIQDLMAALNTTHTGDLFIYGESYAGHYVPATAHRVWQGNQKGESNIPLAGMSVGNGLTDPEIQYQYYGQLAYNYTMERLGKPVISLEQYEEMQSALPGCISGIKKCQTDSTGFSCVLAQMSCNSALLGPYEQTGLNVYNFAEPCAKPPLCYDFSNIETFLSLPSTLQAMGINTQKSSWSSCNYDVNRAFAGDWMKNYQQDIPDMLASGIRVQIYAGDNDFICNWIGNKMWTLSGMPSWPGQQQYANAKDKSWMMDGKEVGLIRQYQNFSFVQVHDAGHMVPMDQPKVALQLINNFLANVNPTN